MGNVHTPQRLDGESREAYAQRRVRSAAIVRRLTQGPTQEKFKPSTGGLLQPLAAGAWWTGQHTTSTLRRAFRHATAVLGSRQARKVMKAERRAVRAEGSAA